MSNWQDGDCYAMYMGMRLQELRADAERGRRARQARRSRRPLPLRAQLGKLLIVAGEALARQPLDAPCVERA